MTFSFLTNKIDSKYCRTIESALCGLCLVMQTRFLSLHYGFMSFSL
ncbi:hypothetical protein [Helicobacter bilis]|nr:hypothetical protein [Helicobacter bilis]